MISRLRISFLLLVMTLLTAAESRASHMVGGDIIYRCLGNNRYELTFILYQDCASGNQEAIRADAPLRFGIFKGADKNIFYTEGQIPNFSQEYIPAEFSNECINNPPIACLQRQIFRTTVTLDTSFHGYRILYQRCCRNQTIFNVINPGETGVTYYVDIPPMRSVGCVNNSPVFKNFPPQIICVNNPFRYDFSATDPDGDSLSYRLCSAYPGATLNDPYPDGGNMFMPRNPLNYLPPYSGANPISANPQLAIDPATGIMTGTPTRQGRYVVTVCVDEWSNGVIKNSISRDVQFTITNCSKSVYASMPSWRDREDVYTIQCTSNTVKFVNTSYGGFSYLWRFGVGDASSTNVEPTFTYPGVGEYEVTLIVNPGTTCTDSITKKVIINPFFDVDYTFEGKMCPNELIAFESEIFTQIDTAISYKWYFENAEVKEGPNTSHVFPPPGGDKYVTLVTESRLGCVDSLTKVIPLDVIDVSAGNDTIIVVNYDFTFNGRGADIYQWSPSTHLSDPNIARPRAVFTDTGTYTYYLKGMTPSGCEDIDTINIRVVLYPHMFLPNAFSPNGDGLNDVLRPTIVGYALVNTFEIYNRFGQLVYKSANDNYPGWDGTYRGQPADVGVYYYRITFTDPFSSDRHEKTGDVTLLR